MKIDGTTRIVGIIGDPVHHSCSPQMHNSLFEKFGLNFVYLPFPVKSSKLATAIEGFKSIGVVGLNVTIPHKSAIIPFLDELSPEAKLIGAVNTLQFQEGKIYGHNSDAKGFIRSLNEAEKSKFSDRSAMVLGAGGAARAIVVALALEGVKSIVVANRTAEKAIALAREISEKTETSISGIGLYEREIASHIWNSNLVINATSIGMKSSDLLPIDPKHLNPNSTVCDIIYTPIETKLLQVARAKGCRTINGIGMLVHQGAIAFELWTSVKADVNEMKLALKKTLNL